MNTLKRSMTGAGIILSLALCSTYASAGADGLFVAAAGQYAQLDHDFTVEDVQDAVVNFDDEDIGYNLGLGWRFNNWLAVDAGYWDFGSFKSDKLPNGGTIGLDATTYTVGGILSVPLWIVDIYARGGAAFWNSDYESEDENGTDPYYGVGVALNVFGHIDLYVEALRFDLKTDLDTVGLGVRITF